MLSGARSCRHLPDDRLVDELPDWLPLTIAEPGLRRAGARDETNDRARISSSSHARVIAPRMSSAISSNGSPSTAASSSRPLREATHSLHPHRVFDCCHARTDRHNARAAQQRPNHQLARPQRSALDTRITPLLASTRPCKPVCRDNRPPRTSHGARDAVTPVGGVNEEQEPLTILGCAALKPTTCQAW